MIPAAILTLVLTIALVILDQKWGLLSGDRFPTGEHRVAAYAWFALLTMVVSTLVISSAQAPEVDVDAIWFPSLFTFHAILVVFLAGWWLLTDRPPIRRFLNLHGDVGVSMLLGVAVGVGGWVITISFAMMMAGALALSGFSPQQLEPSPMIPWMAGLGIGQKILIVLAAMTVEEAFFRGWLQKRVGLIPSTVLFALAHSGYGQPFMVVGVTVISLVIGFIFYKTRNLVPCIIAHGVFDAIQLFVIVPLALKFMPVGS